MTCRFTHVYPDGPAPYFTFLGKAKRGGELEQWAELKRGGERRGAEGRRHHHPSPRRRARAPPWYQREAPPLFLEALRAVKATLDPAGVLNPGVLIAPG